MVVEELPDLAYNALGEDAGFRAVAEITMKGSMRGFKVLHEEARKAGMDLSGLELKEVLQIPGPVLQVRDRRDGCWIPALGACGGA